MSKKNRSLEMKTIKARHQFRYGGTPKKVWSLDGWSDPQPVNRSITKPEIKLAKRCASDGMIWSAREHKGARVLRAVN